MVPRFYIRLAYLRTVHYFFFSLSVFSLTVGIILLGVLTLNAFVMISLSGLYGVISLMTAHYFYSAYRESLRTIIILRQYSVPYVVLSLFTLAATVVMIMFFPFTVELIDSFLYLNYYFFFMLIILFVYSKVESIGGMFQVYNRDLLKRAKKIAEDNPVMISVRPYIVGSDPKVDELLDEVWVHREKPRPWIRDAEIEYCRYSIQQIECSIERMISKTLTPEEKEFVEHMKDEAVHLEKKRIALLSTLS